MPRVSDYLEAFESFSKQAVPKSPAWMNPIRQRALSRFTELGFPTLRHEEWKYTNVDPITQKSFRFAFAEPLNGLAIEKLEPFLFGEKQWTRLVFVNGTFAKNLSLISPDTAGLQVKSLAGALQSDRPTVERYLAQVADPGTDAFTAANTAFIQEGAFVFLPKGKAIEEPIHLLFVTTAQGGEILSQPRNLILAESGSRGTVIESYVSLSPDAYFTNAVTEIVLEEGAELHHYKIQRENESAFHIASTQFLLNRDSRLKSFSLATGARLARNTLRVNLGAEGSECILNGLYLAHGEQHIDNHILVNHTKPRGTSRQLYKGILSGRSHGVFSGKIFVHPDAQKTDAHQTNKNLLLSDQATVDTRPQLEILADDVKCTHGAAVGQLDEEALFYLKSRGMGEERARALLIYGFANEVIDSILSPQVRSTVNRLLLEKLQGEIPAERMS